MVVVFYAKNGTFKIDAAADVSLSNSTVLDTAFASGTAVEGQFKDISVEVSNNDPDIIHLVGVSNSYQNAAMEEKPPGLVEISGTLVLPGDELIEAELFGSATAASTHSTYRMGQATLTQVAFLINADNGSEEVNFAGTNMICTEYKPSLTGADGHFEVSLVLKCLPVDFYGPQFLD